MLNKNQIENGFKALNKQLKQQEVIGDIVIFGGAYMVLALNARASTKDVDAIFKPVTEIRSAAIAVAAELNLPEDWINDGVKGFLPAKSSEMGTKFLNYSNLRVWTPKPEYILAMKCMASRADSHDLNDIKALIKHLGLDAADDVLNIISSYFPSRQIPVKIQFIVDEIFQEQV